MVVADGGVPRAAGQCGADAHRKIEAQIMAIQQSVPPKEITRANAHDVKIIWQDGHESVYPARPLRLLCPCAACVDEMTGKVMLIVSSVSEDVHPLSVRLVGNYAMAIDWSDNHRTGIYPFDLLRRMCPCCQPLPKASGGVGGCGSGGGSCGCSS